uniref:Autophagy protein Atg8 ubiquitin-like protein n=1 Tax=Megaviridae environmental sample TaxID=1737588 RepID=A0A5J6VI58_9VIRU|nr:MAG: autophagy protein Atg8 ubiquitin-like protein [Megaviridae environmental sample]
MIDFKKTKTLEQRIKESNKMREKYPDRTPIICQRAQKTTGIPNIDKNKFLVPHDLTVGQFSYVVRKKLELAPEKAMFLFINNTIPNTSELVSTCDKSHRDEDGFLYITYSSENTFG